ncbi:MAG: DUF5715 family protein [Terriglobales bacterium]
MRAGKHIVTAFLIFAVCTPSFALHSRARYHRPTHVRSSRRVVRWVPVALKGSHDSLLRQNEEIDRLNLVRIQDDQQLQQLVDTGDLVAVPSDRYVRIDPRLEEDHRFCRTWTRDFVSDMGEAYYKEFKQPIQINSAVRTVEQQEKLIRYNHNAAPAEGPLASSHLAGLTVDIAKHGLNRRQRKWMEQYLVRMRDLGLIEAAEERKQACFHVMVSERYATWRQPEKVASR